MATMRFLLLAFITSIASLAPAAEWYEDLSPATQFGTLTELRGTLDLTPDDTVALGRAAAAYVSLGLGSAPAEWQRPGNFMRYAASCLEMRARSKPLSACTTLADAAPDLWYLANLGHLTEVAQVLERLPDADASPLGRALRCLITRDWRALAKQAGRTAIEDYALLNAYAECRLDNRIRTLQVDRDHLGDHVVAMAFSDCEMFSQEEPFKAVIAALHETLIPLYSQTLDDARFRALVAPIAQAVQVSAGGTRDAVLARITAAMDLPEVKLGQVIGAGIEACTALLGDPAGIRDAAGHHLMFQRSDVAAWARDRLALTAGTYHYFLNSRLGDPESARELYEGIKATSPQGLVGWYLACRSAATGGTDVKIEAALLSGLQSSIDMELTRPQGRLREDFLLRGLYLLAKQGQPLGDRVRHLLTLRPPGGEIRWLDAAKMLDIEGPVTDLWKDAVLHDPASFHLRTINEYQDTPMPIVMGIPPASESADAQVDFAALPFPGIAARVCFEIQWDGEIDGLAGGDELALSSDDGANLRLDGRTVINNLDYQGGKARAQADKLAGGWHPLHLDYVQMGGYASCRLLTRHHGSEWLAVPAERLRHGMVGKAAAGLERRVWLLPRIDRLDYIHRDDKRTAAVVRQFAASPWRLLERVQDTRLRLLEGDKAGAMATLRELMEQEPATFGIASASADAKESANDVDGAIADLELYCRSSEEFNVINAHRRIGKLQWKQSRRDLAEAAFKSAATSWQSAAMTDYADFLVSNQRFAEAAVWWDNDDKRYHDETSQAAAAVCRYLAGQDKAAALLAKRSVVNRAQNADYTPFVLAHLAGDADPDAQTLLSDPREACIPRYRGYWLLATGDLEGAHDALVEIAKGDDAAPWFKGFNVLLAAALEPQPGDGQRELRKHMQELNDTHRKLAKGVLDGKWPQGADVWPGSDREVKVLQAMRALASGDHPKALELLKGVTADDDAWRIPCLAPGLRKAAAREPAKGSIKPDASGF